DISGHDRSGRDHRAVSHRDALQDDGAGPDPYAVPEDHGAGRLAEAGAGMLVGVGDDRVPADLAVAAHRDGELAGDPGTLVQEGAFADLEPAAGRDLDADAR